MFIKLSLSIKMKFVLVGEREYSQYFTCLRRNSNNQLVGNLNDVKKRKAVSFRQWAKKQQKIESEQKISKNPENYEQKRKRRIR